MVKDEKKHQKKLMRKRQKDKVRRQHLAAQPVADRRIIQAHDLNVGKEAEYIIRRAQERDGRIISLGELVLFSTQTGDAWVLDGEDELALCLCRDGVRQPFNITDTPAKFCIEWQCNFKIVGDAFCLINEYAEIRTILGYPTNEIQNALI